MLCKLPRCDDSLHVTLFDSRGCRREDIGLRRFSGSLKEKIAWAETRDRPIYALIPEDFPTVAAKLRRLEESGYELIPVEENRLYEIVPQRFAVRT